MAKSLPDSTIAACLHAAELDGQRCAGLVILAGIVVGTGLVQLLVGPMGQTSRFSLQLLLLVILQLAGPLFVSLITTVRLSPIWLQRTRIDGHRAWRTVVLPTVPVASLLMLQFFVSAIISGILMTPRADLLGELSEVLASLRPNDLLRAVARCCLFLLVAAAWSLREALRGIRQNQESGNIVAAIFLHATILLLILKLFWIMVIDPIQLGELT
jgi:hypothetical protein